jgi:hypothetical protein
MRHATIRVLVTEEIIFFGIACSVLYYKCTIYYNSGSSFYTFFVFFVIFLFFLPHTQRNKITITTAVRQGLYILRDRSLGCSKLLNASLKLLLVCTKLEIVIIALLIDCIY